MGSLLPLSLFFWLVAACLGGGSARGRRAERVQGPRGSPPTPSGTSAPFWVRLSPEFAAVPPGGSVWLNCSSNCPLPEEPRLRTRLRLGQKRTGPGWVSYQLLDVRAWSSDVRCFVTCAGETREATSRITAYSEGLGSGPAGGRGQGRAKGRSRILLGGPPSYLRTAAQRDSGPSSPRGRQVHSALSRDACIPRGLLGGDAETGRPGHPFRKPRALYRPGSGQCDPDLLVARWTPRPLAARDLSRTLQPGRLDSPQQFGTRDAGPPRSKSRVQSVGLHLHSCPRGDPSRRGGCLPVQAPNDDADPVVEGWLMPGEPEEKGIWDNLGEAAQINKAFFKPLFAARPK
ncbi:intercellular adhesion molecule 4 isoform X1 [Tupaia chinensis]|uniref:intercellular adhesion molecule 4 isoform X1 n=1 Tax=Tupaia chinensis TaxID=246437 RepID=UPI00070414B9|nr:intercellular adhesion molecule 4 isoform X1 [Tupaia chinensis]